MDTEREGDQAGATDPVGGGEIHTFCCCRCIATFRLARGRYIFFCIVFVISIILFLAYFTIALLYIDDCPAEPAVPVWCLVNSLIPCLASVFYLVMSDLSKNYLRKEAAVVLWPSLIIWLITGTIWFSRVPFNSGANCEWILQTCTLAFLLLTWIMLPFTAVLLAMNVRYIYKGLSERKDHRVELAGLFVVCIVIGVVQLIPGVVFIVRNDCGGHFMASLWSVLSCLTSPLLIVLSGYGLLATSKIILRLISAFGLCGYFAWFITGNVYVIPVFIKDNVECAKTVEGFLIFQLVLCWVCMLIAALILVVTFLHKKIQNAIEQSLKVVPTKEELDRIEAENARKKKEAELRAKYGNKDGISRRAKEVSKRVAVLQKEADKKKPKRPKTPPIYCGYCKLNFKTQVSYPCGHELCGECADKLLQTIRASGSCHICGAQIVEVGPLFI